MPSIQKSLLLTLFASALFAQGMPMMPPMVPNIKSKTTVKKDSCTLVPPMLINLPPMLEEDVQKCKSKRFMPTTKKAQPRLEKLFHLPKGALKVTSIHVVDGFSMLYKIETNVGSVLCNASISKCFRSDFSLLK